MRTTTYKTVDEINESLMKDFNSWKTEAYGALSEIEDLFACTVEEKTAAVALKKALIERFLKLPVAVNSVGFKVIKFKAGATYEWHFKVVVNQMGAIRRKDDPADIVFVDVPYLSENPINEGFLYSTESYSSTIKDAMLVILNLHEIDWRI